MSYLINRGGQQFGPYSADEIQRYLHEGRLLASDVAWKADEQRWITLNDFCIAPIAFTMTPSSAMSLFVGKHFQYYEAKWAVLEVRNSVWSWNWPAFVFSPFWFAYRKLYGYAFFLALLSIVNHFCQAAYGYPRWYGGLLVLGIQSAAGLQANHLYKLHAKKRIREALAIGSTENIQFALMRRGGTSVAAVLILFAVSIAIGYVLGDFN